MRPLVFALLLSAFSAASVSVAHGQFTLTVSLPLSPSAVDPGGSPIATLDLEPNGSSSPVSFSTIPCTVTPVQTTGTPQCLVSPDPATPPSKPSLTVTTTGATPPGLYVVTVTGDNGSTSQSVTLAFNVVNVTQDYTLSVSPATATPSPVKAGATATTTVTVHPVAYTGNVTLACLTVTPTVALAPVCSFNPPTVMVTSSSAAPTSVLTISTTGPTTSLRNQRPFYAMWLAIPGLALVGVGAAGARRKNVLAALLLLAMAASLLLLPACGSSKSNTTTTSSGTVTPANTYTFTLTGADQNGAAPSSTTATTVTLAVN